MLSSYNTEPPEGVSNYYENVGYPHDLRAPVLMGCFGVRNSGKSYLVSKYLIHSQKRKRPLYDRVFMITPTYKSNESYWMPYITEEDARQPTDESIGEVIEELEEERNEWDRHIEALKEYNRIIEALKNNVTLSDDELTIAHRNGWLETTEWLNNKVPDKPVWKHHREGQEDRPTTALLIMDDVLGNKGMLASSHLMKLACLNRHVAPLREAHVSKSGNTRTSIGLSLIFLSQSYRLQLGPGRVLRENLTHAVVFKNKQPKQLLSIVEELGSSVDADRFIQAYDIATSKKYGSVLVDFNPIEEELQFREGLNKAIIIPKTREISALEMLRMATS